MQWLEQPFTSAVPASALPAALGSQHSSPGQVFAWDPCAASIPGRAFLSCSLSTEALPVTFPPVFRRSRAGKWGSCRAGFIGVFPVHETSTFLHPWNLGVGHRSSCQIWANSLCVHPPGAWAAPISCCFGAPSSPCSAPSELWGHRNTFSTNMETGLEQLYKFFIIGGSPVYLILVF